jgi:hypothetical protein
MMENGEQAGKHQREQSSIGTICAETAAGYNKDSNKSYQPEKMCSLQKLLLSLYR